jgi:formate dehydrogenase major subunit
MNLSRRQLIKLSGGVAAGLAAASIVDAGGTKRAYAKVEQGWKIRDTRQAAGICPYCAVGCGTIVHARERTPGRKDWQIVNIEGNPDSPISGGTLCPKGAASFQLAVNEKRQTKVLYRAPGGTDWQEKSLDEAMQMIAERVKKARDENWQATVKVRGADGNEVEKKANRTLAIATLGGATMDNEWNHIQQKLMRGLGVVAIENQARI